MSNATTMPPTMASGATTAVLPLASKASQDVAVEGDHMGATGVVVPDLSVRTTCLKVSVSSTTILG